jgi:hypothetical protein
MSVTVRALSPTRRNRKRFIDLEWEVYRGDPAWVPPLKMDMHAQLNPDKNPYHEHAETQLFLAERDGKPVGRIAAHVNHNHEAHWHDGVGFFGFFECFDDQEAANALFDAARTFLREHGRSAIRGPFSWSANDPIGIQIDQNHRSPTLMMPYNPAYYAGLVEGAGLEKAKDLYAYWIHDPGYVPDRLRRGVEISKKRNKIEVRPFNPKDFWNEAERIKYIYRDAWEDNWSSVPITDKEFEHLARDLKQGLDPRIVYFAYVNDELAGFSLSLPDANQAIKHANGRLLPFGLLKILWHMRHVQHVRVLLLGVLGKFRNHAVDVALYHETFDVGRQLGYTSAEMSWILEDNYAMINPLEKFGAQRDKTYRVYEQPL